jgi:uncharacterized delta-60 repeat protein
MNTDTAGNLDPSFNGNGKVFPTETKELFGHAFAVLVTSNGNLFMAGRLGNGYSIISLKKDGTTNLDFNGNGIVKDVFKDGFFSIVKGIQLTENNEILISGLYHETDKINHHAFAKYRQDGSLNTDFGVKGKAIIRAIPGGTYQDVPPASIPLADGGVLVSSTQTVYGKDIGVLYRLHKNGNIDSNIGGGKGFADVKYLENQTTIASMQLQSDGKILFAGKTYVDNRLRSYVARYGSDHTIDPEFGEKGFFINPAASNYDQIYSIKLDADGKVLAVGGALQEDRAEGLILRLTNAGHLDTEFNNGKPLLTTLDKTISDVEFLNIGVQSDNKIVVQGNSLGGEIADIIIARFLPNGTLDPTFGTGKETGTGGWVRTKLGLSVDMGHAMVVEANDRTVVVGSYSFDSSFEGLRQFAIRYLN